MSAHKKKRALLAAIAAVDARADARADFLARNSGNVKAFAGGCSNFAPDGRPMFGMKSRPGFQPTTTERGRTIRSGKKNTLKLVRPNPAAGEEPMASPRFANHEAIDRAIVETPIGTVRIDGTDTGEIVEGLQPFPPHVQANRRYDPSKVYGYKIKGA